MFNNRLCSQFHCSLLYFLLSEMRLVDGKEFRKMNDALELKAFQGIAYKHIDSAKDELLKKLVEKRYLYHPKVPSSNPTLCRHSKCFYHCVKLKQTFEKNNSTLLCSVSFIFYYFCDRCLLSFQYNSSHDTE